MTTQIMSPANGRNPIAICTVFQQRARVLSQFLHPYSAKPIIIGPISVVTVEDGTAGLDAYLRGPIRDRVIFINAHCEIDVSFFGKKQLLLASEAGVAGIVLFGSIHNVEEIGESYIPIRAMGVSPRAMPNNVGTCREGSMRTDTGPIGNTDLVVGNRDGVVVIDSALYFTKFPALVSRRSGSV